MKIQKSILSIVVIAILGVLLMGCGDSSTTDTGETTETGGTTEVQTNEDQMKSEYIVGDTVEAEGMMLTVLGVEKSPGAEYDTPKSGNEYVIVTVKYENASDKDLSYNPYDFKILNSNGQKTDTAFSMLASDNQLNSGDLAPGGTITGDLVFEGPIGDEGLYLIYTGNIFKSEGIQIKL